MKKIVLIKGSSKYNVLRYWMDMLAIGFEKCNVQTIVLDLLNSTEEQILKTLALDVDAVLSFNGLLLEQQQVIKKVIKAPYIYLLIDHPIDHLGRIQNLRQGDILTVMDRYDSQNLNTFGYNVNNLYFLPHAALEMQLTNPIRSIDILVSGTYSNPDNFLSYINEQSTIIQKICYEVINICIEDSSKYYIDEFLTAFNTRGAEITLRLNETPEFIKMVREIGRYIYSINRLKVIKALAEAGLYLHIYGEGWSNSPLINCKNITIHDSVNFWEIQKLMNQSKVVLNFQALLKDGTHERIFAGMAAGAAVVTNETPYLKQLFKEDEEIIFYNFNDMDNIVKKVKAILLDEQLRENISEAGWHAINGIHTFEQRAKQIIDIYNDVYK